MRFPDTLFPQNNHLGFILLYLGDHLKDRLTESLYRISCDKRVKDSLVHKLLILIEVALQYRICRSIITEFAVISSYIVQKHFESIHQLTAALTGVDKCGIPILFGRIVIE